ncbi:hypothetical protein FNV43_RR07771 [Rhamnella rubrinervis]|uniref:Xyloglucan endotransglucosylase/hydrolase n=1 Tax=Rhamnella rubrinervis TaxID=2594499 RepID=A0A8K0HFZ5_9ROSA|nr:hypothetical protein FNV43_RR07771 [Rhamnella rubrinervis]
MERRVSPMPILVSIAALLLAAASSSLSEAADSKGSFEDNFDIMWSEDHFTTSEDGQIWHLSLDKETGCGFQTKQRFRFGWFSMKLKLVGGDSAGVVTAYYMCTENGAGPERDELDFEFLGNRTGEPYLIQTNIYKNGTGGREMRHVLWFDPTEEFHSYSVLWNNEQIVFFVDKVPMRVFKNNGKENNFFPNEKPMYLFSSIWNADDWATRGGLEKTDWKKAPFISSYKDFNVDGCQWEDPFPACVSTTTKNWWDQYDAWHLSDSQKLDYGWVLRNLVIYDYCKDTERYPTLPEECEKKLSKVIVPDKWKEGASNTTEGGGRKINENKLLSKKKRWTPYGTTKCTICKQQVHQDAKYCHTCAYTKGVCAMCGKQVLDTKLYKQSNV